MNYQLPAINDQRLRYEAFSNFASDLNRCNTFEETGKVLSIHLKFIVDSFIFRMCFLHGERTVIFEVYRGVFMLSIPGKDDGGQVLTFETESLKNGIPLLLAKEQLRSQPSLRNSIFNNPKVETLYSLPLIHTDESSVIGMVATRNPSFSESDFRFFRLFCEAAYNKLLQIDLLITLGAKQTELEQKNIEISQLNSNLERMVEERTADLTDSNTELLTLFYHASHDFRSPLTSILGISNLIDTMTSDPEILVFSNSLKDIVQRVDGMLNKLNMIGRIMIPDAEPICFTTILKAAEEKYGTAIAEQNLRLVLEDTTTISLSSGCALVSLIMENVIENSVHFARRDTAIHVLVQNDDQQLLILVRDNGEGVKPEILPRIFEMYYRGNYRSQGHGLGLYVARKLVRHLSGNISLSSGNGTTEVRIELPLDKLGHSSGVLNREG
jgi:signal transduction histidine kinase